MRCFGLVRPWHVGFLCSLLTLLNASSAHAEWLSIQEVLTLAQSRALPVVDAGGQIGVAQAMGVGARMSSIGNPHLEIIADRGTSYNTATRTLPAPHVQIIGQLWIPFDVGGQRSARIEEANRLLEWRRLGLVGAQSQVLGEVLHVYGQTVISAARLAESAKGEESAKREVLLYEERLQAGDATVYEQKLSQAELARWQQTRAEVQVRLNVALSRLSQLTGVTPIDGPPNGTEYRTPALRVVWNEAAIARVVERTPAVSALRSEQVYWGAAQERAERDKIPPMSLILQGGRGDLAEPRIGAGLAWTFPVLRRNQGEIARTGAERTRAQGLEQTTRRVIETRVRGAVLAYRTLGDALAIAEQTGIPAAEGTLEAAEQGFRAGKTEIVRVLIARRDLALAHFRRLDLLDGMWQVYGELAALNGGFP